MNGYIYEYYLKDCGFEFLKKNLMVYNDLKRVFLNEKCVLVKSINKYVFFICKLKFF